MNLEDTKKYLLVFIPGLSLLFFNYGNYWSSHWYSKWSLIVAMFSLFYSFLIATKTYAFLFPVILLSLVSASWTGFFFDNQYKHLNDTLMQYSIQNGAMYSYFAIVMATVLISYLPVNLTRIVQNYLASVCILSAAYMVLEFNKIPYERAAFSGNAGMSANLVACLMPFALQLKTPYPFTDAWFKSCIVFMCFLACTLSHSSIGNGTFIVVLSCVLLRKFSVPLKNMAIIGLSWSVPLLLALKLSPVEWLSSSGRMTVWKSCFHWWTQNTNHYFGAGLGTSISMLSYIQKMSHTDGTGYYLWMHSEPLQILWELGYTGAACVALALIGLLFRSWAKPHLFSSLVGFITCSIADYPLRLPIHCTAATLLCWLIVQNKRAIS